MPKEVKSGEWKVESVWIDGFSMLSGTPLFHPKSAALTDRNSSTDVVQSLAAGARRISLRLPAQACLPRLMTYREPFATFVTVRD